MTDNNEEKRDQPMTMDVRKAQGSAKTRRKMRSLEWIGGIKQEFKKITWTSRSELKTYTKVVVGSMLVVGLAIYGTDVAVQGILSGISSLIKAVIG